MIIKNIQKVHAGEDYSTYSYVDVNGKEQEVEITDFAQVLIDTLGKALYKSSFIKKDIEN